MNTCEICGMQIVRDGRTFTGWQHVDSPDPIGKHSPRPTYVQCAATTVLRGWPAGVQVRCEILVLPDDEGHEHRHTITWEAHQ